MTSIGHRTGLFDALANQPPATSTQIAAQTGLQERYGREWLHAMTTGRVVDYNPADQTFQLPAEHSMWLTRAAGVNNFASFIQFVPLLAKVEDPIIECFRNGGVPYASFPHFHSMIAEGTQSRTDTALINNVLPLITDLSD